jgi:hypothetical protein
MVTLDVARMSADGALGGWRMVISSMQLRFSYLDR